MGIENQRKKHGTLCEHNVSKAIRRQFFRQVFIMGI